MMMMMVLLLEAPRVPTPVQQFSSHSYNRCHGSCRRCTSDQKEDLITLLVQAQPQQNCGCTLLTTWPPAVWVVHLYWFSSCWAVQPRVTTAFESSVITEISLWKFHSHISLRKRSPSPMQCSSYYLYFPSKMHYNLPQYSSHDSPPQDNPWGRLLQASCRLQCKTQLRRLHCRTCNTGAKYF